MVALWPFALSQQMEKSEISCTVSVHFQMSPSNSPTRVCMVSIGAGDRVHTYVCMYVCMFACMYVCMYGYIYVCMYVCTHQSSTV